MTRYIGMDVHKRQVEICMMDQKGKVLKRIRCACTREVLQKLAHRRFTQRDHVALETTTNAWAVADLIRPYVARVTKSGRSQARWMVIQAAHHLAKTHGPLGAFFRRIATRSMRCQICGFSKSDSASCQMNRRQRSR